MRIIDPEEGPEDPDPHHSWPIWAIVILLVIVLGLIVHIRRSSAHDHARPDLNGWFDSLRSGKGPCCSNSDGVTVADADWEAVNDAAKPTVHYRVRIADTRRPGDPMIWLDVPDEAVLATPNLDGRTIVWPIAGYEGMFIRCFIPGSMS